MKMNLAELLDSNEKLEAALRNNKSLIRQQDEAGRTLLHHAAATSSYRSNIILSLLFKTRGIDFTIKDKAGNTPLHVAALHCGNKKTWAYIFPSMVAEAAKREFDFSTLGNGGQSVLHIATRVSYNDYRFLGRRGNVHHVLENASKPGLDVLSSAGATALYYAIIRGHIDEANVLLNAGANPQLCGSEDRSPLAVIEEHLRQCKEALTDEDFKQSPKADNALEFIKQLNELKDKMLRTNSSDNIPPFAATEAEAAAPQEQQSPSR